MPESVELYERSKLVIINETLNAILSLLHNGEDLKKKFASESIVYAEISEESQAEIEKILYDVYRHREDKNFQAVFLSAVIRLLVYIDENQVDRILPSADAFIVSIEYINSHISEDIKIDDICNAVHLSKYHFCREFKKMTGQTLMEYVMKTRIALAKNMLVSKKRTIREVSESCGFSSMSYFCRVFKKESGMTPSEFRRNGEKEK